MMITLALSKMGRLFKKIVRHDKINTEHRKFWRDAEFLASRETDYSEGKKTPFITSLRADQ